MALTANVRVIKFWTKYTPNGKGGFKETDMVEYCAIGKAHMATTVASVSSLGKLQPLEPGDDNMAVMMAHARWNSIKPQYDAWKQGREAPIDGTPLAAWPGISSEQAEFLRNMGIRTVEEIAEASDSIITRIPFPGARELRSSAQAFLKAADKTKVASELTDLKEKLAERDEQLEDLRQIVLEMQGAKGDGQTSEGDEETPAPRRRRRAAGSDTETATA